MSGEANDIPLHIQFGTRTREICGGELPKGYKLKHHPTAKDGNVWTCSHPRGSYRTDNEDDARDWLFFVAAGEIQNARAKYPEHSTQAAIENHRAGREVWDTNGDLR